MIAWYFWPWVAFWTTSILQIVQIIWDKLIFLPQPWPDIKSSASRTMPKVVMMAPVNNLRYSQRYKHSNLSLFHSVQEQSQFEGMKSLLMKVLQLRLRITRSCYCMRYYQRHLSLFPELLSKLPSLSIWYSSNTRIFSSLSRIIASKVLVSPNF